MQHRENFFFRSDPYLPELRQLRQLIQGRMVTGFPGSLGGPLTDYYTKGAALLGMEKFSNHTFI